MRIQYLLPYGALFASTALLACGSNTAGTGPGGNVGGTSSSSTSTSTSTNVGGSTSVGGSGKTSTTSNTSAGGNTAVGGTSAGQGGTNSTSTTGTKAVGGATAAVGGKTGVGGTSATAGGTSSTKAVGGTSAAAGGTSSTKAVGGATGVGGTSAANGGTSAAAGASSTVAGGSGTRPKGFYLLSDWKVTTPDWHGCVWTGQDSNVASSTTKITPQDFLTIADGGPYQIGGKVTADPNYNGVAMLGFNISEPITDKADQCKYVAGVAGPADISIKDIVSSTKGLAINWVAKTKPAEFRVQLQAKASLTDLSAAWCATIADAQGPSFVKWADFSAYCWNQDGSDTKHPVAKPYAGEDIDAISFLVPGNTAETPFDFTVTGFAPGDSKDAAPGTAPTCGSMTGTLGSKTTASQVLSMQRAAVTATDCKKYIVFNNNWGQASSTKQTIDYTGNSFTVTSSEAATSGQGVPGSFPSVYIGANGDLASGTYDTWSDSGLPKQISAMQSASTTFTWSGKSGGNYNAAYDIWFSKSKPTAGGYNDAISGFIMVWLYKPGGASPIAKSNASSRTTGTIAGHKWDVWVGPRGNTSTGTDDANRPVVSYVVQGGPVNTLTFDIKDFIADAVTNAAADKTAGGTSQSFDNSWYLTDVFAGFEAWSGGDIVGNKATMSCTVK